MTSETLGLGDFGDERLAKRGVCCAREREWWRARASAAGAWRAEPGRGRQDGSAPGAYGERNQGARARHP